MVYGPSLLMTPWCKFRVLVVSDVDVVELGKFDDLYHGKGGGGSIYGEGDK